MEEENEFKKEYKSKEDNIKHRRDINIEELHKREENS